ncbi:MAG: uroporphyrinogen-III synthase [Deltaproteobacteria bacterium]|nr:uroporphyrinogen-III synthase [Deltaproteobacteria bacterium]
MASASTLTSDAQQGLAGRRIVVTRARAQANALAQRIEELGGEIFEFPTIEIQPPEDFTAFDAAVRNIESYDWLIFTSVNGVAPFLDRLGRCGKDEGLLAGINVGAIGPETAKTLEGAGIKAELVPQQFQAEGILETLSPAMMRGKRVLMPRAAKAREILPDTLRQWGATVDVVVAYQTVLPAPDTAPLARLIHARAIDAITFTSSSTVSNFVRLFQQQKLSEIVGDTPLACIGPITAKTVSDLGGTAQIVAQEFTIPGLVAALVDFFGRSDRSPRRGSEA